MGSGLNWGGKDKALGTDAIHEAPWRIRRDWRRVGTNTTHLAPACQTKDWREKATCRAVATHWIRSIGL